MATKVICSGLIVAALLGSVGFTRLRTETNMLGDNVGEVIEGMESTSRMLARARSDIKYVEKDLTALYSNGAECQRNVSRIEEDIAAGTKNIAEREHKLKLVADALEKNPQTTLFRFGGKDYSRADVIADVANKTRELNLLNTTMERKRIELSTWRTNSQAVKEKITAFAAKKEELLLTLADLERRTGASAIDCSGIDSDSSYMGSAEKTLAAAKKRIEAIEQANSFKKSDTGIDPVDVQPGDSSLRQEEDVLRHARESMKLSNPPAPPPVIAPQNTPAAGVIERRNSGVKYVALDKNNPPLISFVN